MAASLLPLLLSGGIRAARAQALPQPSANGRTIEAIEFKGLKALSEETLRYYLGLDVREIAGHLGIAEGTVKAMLFRARRSLADALGEEVDRADG